MLVLGFLNTGLDSDCSWKGDRYLAAPGEQELKDHASSLWDSKVPSQNKPWDADSRVKEERERA